MPHPDEKCPHCGERLWKDHGGMLERMHDVRKCAIGRASILARDIYARAPTGCCLHIVLDDRNEDDASVEFSLKLALDRSTSDPVHEQCFELADLLLEMTPQERHDLRVAPPDR